MLQMCCHGNDGIGDNLCAALQVRMQEVFHWERASSIIPLRVNVPSTIHMQEVVLEMLVSVTLNLRTAAASRHHLHDTPDWLPSSLRILATVMMFSMVMHSTRRRQMTTTIAMVWLDLPAVPLGMIDKHLLITTTTTWLQVCQSSCSLSQSFIAISAQSFDDIRTWTDVETGATYLFECND